MHITIICIPYQVDVARWGCANGPQAFLDHGLIPPLEAKGHTITAPIWIELPKAERTRDSVTNLGRIAQRTAVAVRQALEKENAFVLVLEGDCTHALGPIGGLAQAQGHQAWYGLMPMAICIPWRRPRADSWAACPMQ